MVHGTNENWNMWPYMTKTKSKHTLSKLKYEWDDKMIQKGGKKKKMKSARGNKTDRRPKSRKGNNRVQWHSIGRNLGLLTDPKSRPASLLFPLDKPLFSRKERRSRSQETSSACLMPWVDKKRVKSCKSEPYKNELGHSHANQTARTWLPMQAQYHLMQRHEDHDAKTCTNSRQAKYHAKEKISCKHHGQTKTRTWAILLHAHVWRASKIGGPHPCNHSEHICPKWSCSRKRWSGNHTWNEKHGVGYRGSECGVCCCLKGLWWGSGWWRTENGSRIGLHVCMGCMVDGERRDEPCMDVERQLGDRNGTWANKKSMVSW